MSTVRQADDALLVRTIAGQIARPSVSLHRNFSWAFAGNVIYCACQWGILTILAKLGSVEMVGQFALALAITTPVALFFQFQL